MKLQANWELQYEELFNAKARRNDRRSLKRLNEEGKVEFLRPTEQKAQEEMLEALIKQKRTQIEATGEQHHLSCPQALKFYRQLPANFRQSEDQNLVLTGLSLNGKLIAISCGIASNRRYFGLFMAMDADFRKFSPGRLLLLDINRQLCEDGIQIHEFGNGDYQYKKAWNCVRHERITITAPASLLGRLSLPIARKILEYRRTVMTRAQQSPSGSAPPSKSAD